jgi:hypothetical protein
MNPFTYPASSHSRRHGPEGYADHASFRPWLRDEFQFRCVYCLLREQWGRVRGSFGVDHFLPMALHPKRRLSYDNLVYCCQTCNEAKGKQIIPDPRQCLMNGAVTVRRDGSLDLRTPEARRIVRKLGLDEREAREYRALWIGIIGMAERYDLALHRRLMGYPDDLPNLARLRPPGGNTRPVGVAEAAFARRNNGTLSPTY